MNRLYIIIPSVIMLIVSAAYVAAAGGYKNITPRQASRMINSGKSDLLILDVRTVREYRDGHLKGSKLIPIRTLPERIREIRDYRESEIIVYCAAGGRSRRAADFLSKRGFTGIFNMVGGIREWGRLGFKVER